VPSLSYKTIGLVLNMDTVLAKIVTEVQNGLKIKLINIQK